MNIKIRRGVFETNSSSTHSISLSNGDMKLDKLPVRDGVCIIYTGEFGWEIESYNDAPTKAAYCLTYALSNGNGDINSNNKLKMLKRAIESELGSNIKVAFDIRNPEIYGENGYIDHQSIDVADEVFESEETIRRFIFDKNSFLYTDNDNH